MDEEKSGQNLVVKTGASGCKMPAVTKIPRLLYSQRSLKSLNSDQSNAAMQAGNVSKAIDDVQFV